jgi:anion-transporting  ArsA/GET3 family ATPase
VLDVVRMGPLRRRSEDIRELLTDVRRTQCLLLTRAEELPVRETLELRAALRAIRMPIGPVLVNRVEPELELDVETVRARLAELPTDGAPPLASPGALSSVLDFRAQRGAQQRHWIEALQAQLADPLWRVPELSEPLQGRRGVERLADALAPKFLGAAA